MEAKGTRLKKRGAIWYIVYTGNSRGKSTGTGDRGLAEEALAAFIQRKDENDEASEGLTVHQALEDYLQEHARPSKEDSRQGIRSVRQAEIAAGYFIAHFPADCRIVDVRPEDIDFPKDARKPTSGNGYIQKRRDGRLGKGDVSDGSLIREISGVLVAAFTHAAKKKRIKMGDIPYLPRPTPPPPKDRWLSIDEEAQLVAACPVEKGNTGRLSRIYRFLILALETAARKEALETLTWFQVDFRAGTINLNPAGRQQTNKRRSVVRISTRLRAVLERAWSERQGGWVLDDEGDIRTSFDNLVTLSGLAGVTPHVLRHTWATRAAQAGVSMREIADWLGDNIATVEKNYYHHSPHYLKDAIDWREREQPAAWKKEESKK